ncbi:hypothetical protein Y032_0075g962 [Ancylostoma ceylanicum]|nr:hypothetical protein Y032_0075g962 [Ancylostoma ceylanicum]
MMVAKSLQQKSHFVNLPAELLHEEPQLNPLQQPPQCRQSPQQNLRRQPQRRPNHAPNPQEYRLINDVAEELFPNKDFESMGIWIYGHSRRFLSIDDSLNNMYANLQDFEQALWDNDVIEVEKPLNTSDAIKVINKLEDARHRANCLIFLSAQQDTSTLPRLDPSPSRSGFQRIVAIGFNGTLSVIILLVFDKKLHDFISKKKNFASHKYAISETDLQHVVVQPQGVALSIPLQYMGWDIKAVVNAVLKKP